MQTTSPGATERDAFRNLEAAETLVDGLGLDHRLAHQNPCLSPMFARSRCSAVAGSSRVAPRPK
jgi:hypothetical protein